MNNYYKYKNILTFFLLLTTACAAQAATNSAGVSIWYDTGATGGLTAAQAQSINADTVTFWEGEEPNDSGGEDCATQEAGGRWNDTDCSDNNPAACFDGSNWVLSGNTNYASVSCPVNTVFAAPVTRAQRDQLISVMNNAGESTVYINADDRGTENIWLINAAATTQFAPFWNTGEPNDAGGNEDCAEVQTDGRWNDIPCDAARPLACADAGLTVWQVTGGSYAFTRVDDLNQVCEQEFGAGYQFAAPRTAGEQSALNNVLAGPVLVNATDRMVEGYWMLNHGIFNWAPGYPASAQGNCVTVRQSDGRWISTDCDDSAYLTCTDGTDWLIRNSSHIFSNAVLDICARPDNDSQSTNPYRNYYLAAPRTEQERSQVSAAIQAQPTGASAWLNVKHLADAGRWLWNDGYQRPLNGGDLRQLTFYDVYDDEYEFLNGPWTRPDGTGINLQQAQQENLASYSLFAPVEPNDSGDCVQLYTDVNETATYANWDDTGCDNAKHVACYDGNEWRISPSATSIGGNNENPENLSAAFAACAAIEKNGVAGNFAFATPTSFKQTRELLAIAIGGGYNDGIWININDKRYEGTFIYNLGMDVLAPFWNDGEPGGAALENCAVQRQTGTLWDDVSCTNAYPIACYDPGQGNNGDWKITSADYSVNDIAALSAVCESAFDGRYKFYAPQTLTQKNDLVAVMAAAGVERVFINASDEQSENSWKLNQEINNWAADQPSSDGSELCVSANLASGLWQARPCSDELPVACSSGSIWSFSATAVTLENFSAAQEACDAVGDGLLFAAPRVMDSVLGLQYYAHMQGLGGDVWINGNRLQNVSHWTWNEYQVAMPSWGDAQPDGGESENCALLMNNDAASWTDEACDSSSDHAYLCHNGSQWALSSVRGTLSDFSSAVAACADLGAGWRFAAPQTYNDNISARAVMGAESSAWINATDTVKEGQWITNAANIAQYPAWAAFQPDNGGITAAAESTLINGEDCVYQDNNGQWFDTSCTSAAEYSWACTDGYTWKVTRQAGRIQSLADGHKQCFSEYGSGYVFAVPLNMDDAIQLDFARLQAALDSDTVIDRVWLNITDGGREDNVGGNGSGSEFRRNLPFTNWIAPYPGQEPEDVCVFKSTVGAGQNNPWRTADCTANAAHYACFNGSDWQVATSQGTLVNGSVQIVPQAGDDYWSYERGNRLCKDQFGASYYFSAPVTAAEEQALDTAIRLSPAQVKNTWLNYYYVSNIATDNNRWFADRLKLGIWQKPVFDNYNNSDCALLDSAGNWTDVPCHQDHAYACFNGQWQVVASGPWNNGFAACENQNAVFAVPRTPGELNALRAEMGSSPVWINLTDTALESQWIANRLRYAWWSDSEPSNISNRDCARMNTQGEWYAAKCLVEEAPFACRKVTGSNIEWFVSSEAGVWSRGFSVCAAEFEDSEFFAPHAFGNQSATLDQQALAAIVAAAGQDVWLNMSDQEVEGSWRPYQVYGDWGINTLLDENNDCAYFDRVTAGSGTWYADACKYTAATAVSRGFACTNGYEWRIVNSAATTEQRWSAGFTACDALDTAEEDWTFAAPTDAVQNAKLKLAMELSDLGQVWINAHDRYEDGDWQINGAETNFPVVADTSATALLVNEQQTGLLLSATLADDEALSIASAEWTLAAASRFADVSDSGVTVSNNALQTGAAGTGSVTANYDAPRLLQQDALLTFKLTVTDIPPGTASAVAAEYFVTVRVKAPILAHYDFNSASVPQQDISGNGHHALNTAANPFPDVFNGALSLNEDDAMVVPGLAQDTDNGLDIPAEEYTVAFRLSVEDAGSASGTGARGILHKGDTAAQRQPLMTLAELTDELLVSQTTAGGNQLLNAGVINDRQWLNIIYQKTVDSLTLYIDNEPVSVVDISGQASLANNGNLYIGHGPGVERAFIGLMDDIQIFNRALSSAERDNILPPPPAGRVQFRDASSIADEFESPDNSVTIHLERSRGSKQPLTVYVDFNAAASTAQLGTQTDLVSAADPVDIAFDASYVSGSGMAVSWPADTRGTRSFTILRDTADDGIREGTELARFSLVDSGDAEAGTQIVHTLRLTDLTPNPYGNFSVTAPDNNIIPENDPAVHPVCINRESGTTGEVTVNYEISGNAVQNTDFQYLASGLIPAGNAGSVVFADGDGSPQCFDIQAIDNPDIGVPDKDLTISLTGLNYDAQTLDPLLTAQDQAQLLFRDYEAGNFSFSANSYSCKEPNTGNTVPDELKPSPAELTCELTVLRSDTSLYAPPADILVSVTPDSAADFSYTGSLQWPALTAAAPASPSSEEQTITFTLVNDDDQETDEVVTVSLSPTPGDGHSENILVANADLTLIDVTSPALMTIADNTSTVLEGQKLAVNILRAGNPATEFSLIRNVEVLNKTLGKTDADYLSFAYSDPAGQSDTLNFNKGASPATETLEIRTRDVLFNGNADYTVRVTLSDPVPGRVVGLGTIDNANQDAGVNQTYRDFIITDDNSVNDQIQVTQSAGNNNATSTPGTYYAIDDFLGQRGEVDLEVVIPSRTGVDKKHERINYSWQLLTGPGADLTSESGSFAYTDTLSESERTFETTLTLPFTYQSSITTEVLLTVWGGPDNDITKADEVYEEVLVIRSAPRWRRLVFDGSRCVAWDDGDDRYEANNCSTSVSNSELWTYNPVSGLMINKGDDACATGWTDLDRTDCNTGSPFQWDLVNDSGSLNIRVRGDSEVWCRMSTDQRINVRNTGVFSCSGEDDRYSWGADQ